MNPGIPESAKGAASKAGHVFTTYILPLAAFGAGYFAGVVVFQPLAGWIAEIAAESGSTAGTTLDIASAFGGSRNGVALVLSLILAGIGFYMVKDGQPWVTVGLFLLGAALAIGIKGMKGQSLVG